MTLPVPRPSAVGQRGVCGAVSRRRGTRLPHTPAQSFTRGVTRHDAATGVGGGAPASSELLSSELLGFPTDARVLIVNVDDVGMSHSVNRAALRAIESGLASSCSVMVPCPAAVDAVELLRQRPHIPFGVHLTLVRDTPYGWGPSRPGSGCRPCSTTTGGSSPAAPGRI